MKKILLLSLTGLMSYSMAYSDVTIYTNPMSSNASSWSDTESNAEGPSSNAMSGSVDDPNTAGADNAPSANIYTIDNAVDYVSLGSNIGSFDAVIEVSSTQNYSGQYLALFNSAGTQGYALSLDSGDGNGEADQSTAGDAPDSGTGTGLALWKFNVQPSNEGFGLYSGSAPNAPYGTYNLFNGSDSTYLTASTRDNSINDINHFNTLELNYNATTGTLTGYLDGIQELSYTDVSPYTTFSDIYLEGGTNGEYYNLTVTSPTPEPSSLALLGVGGFAMLAYVLRRRKALKLA